MRLPGVVAHTAHRERTGAGRISRRRLFAA